MADPNYIMISDPRAGDVAFLLPAKCANTSIKQALLMQRNEPVDTTDPMWFVRIHSGAMFRYVSRTTAAQAAHIVGVVREPVERIISLWRDKVAGVDVLEFRQPGKVTPRMPWGEFVDAVACDTDADADQHWRSLTYELCLPSGRGYPDTVLRTQCLRDDWAKLEQRFGWRHLGIPRLNASESKAGRPEVTEEQRRKIEARYYYDYQNFGGYFV